MTHTDLIFAFDWATLVGFVGMACCLGAYAYLTSAPAPNLFIVHGANLTGAVLLTVSLLVHTNLPSLVLEACWGSIALFGLIKAWRARRAAQ